MKRIIASSLLALFLSAFIFAQTDDKKDKHAVKPFYISFGIGIGGFNPQQVNDYINASYDQSSVELGFLEMVMYYSLNANTSLFFTKFTEFAPELELSFAPKMIMNNNENDSYLLSRVSPGAKFNFHIPMGKKASFFIGTGLSYSFIKFKSPDFDYTAKDLGFSFQTGVMLRFGKMAIQPHLAINLINGETDDFNQNMSSLNYSSQPRELNFSGANIGCKVMF